MYTGDHYNEKELLALVADEDEAAFTKLFNHYANHIYAIAIKFTGSAVMAEETVQEVFMKIWLKKEHLTDIRDFKAYLFIITRNYLYRVLSNNAKKYKKDQVFAAMHPLAQNSSETAVLDKEYGSLLQQAIDRLPEQQKKVYCLVKEMGLKREEAARLLQIHPETIKYHLAQAMKSLRSYCLPYLDIYLLIPACFSFAFSAKIFL